MTTLPGQDGQQQNSNDFNGNGLPTLIGSLPVLDHDQALELIFSHTPAIPLWPQLPANPLEGMLNQFIEGFPGIVEESQRTYFNSSTPHFEAEQLAFYEDYMAVLENPAQLEDSRFQVSRQRANGLYRLVEQALSREKSPIALKGQITGPFTLLTGLHDQNKRLGYYDPAIRELMVKGLALRAAWQVTFLRRAKLPVIVFIDEPALAGLGSSSFISVALDDIAQDLDEVVQAIQQAGGLAGIHVCANTDWNLLLTSKIDVLSFDAYGFFDRLLLCKENLLHYLNRGGIIAWGIVPTAEEDVIRRETAESLAQRWEDCARQLADETWDLPAILGSSLITPSCGTGSLSPELAIRVLELTRDVSDRVRRKYLP